MNLKGTTADGPDSEGVGPAVLMGPDAGTYARLVATIFFWGGTFVAARWLGGEIPPFRAASLRFVLATLVLFGILAARREPWPLPAGGAAWRRIAWLGLTGIFLYNAVFFLGLRLTTAANASLIVAVNPILTALLAAALLRERLGRWQVVGLVLSLAGVAVIVSGGNVSAVAVNRGDLLLLGAPVCWALFTVLGRRPAMELGPLAATAWASLAGTLMLVPAALIEWRWGSFPGGWPTVSGWLAILQLALLGTVAGFVWWSDAVRRMGAARAAVFVNLVPVFAILQASLLLGERLLPIHLAGGLLVLGGVRLAQGTSSARR